jgi:hypothetical protein
MIPSMLRLVVLVAMAAWVLDVGSASAQGRGRLPRSRLLVRSVPELGLRAGWSLDAEAVGLGTQIRYPAGPFADLVASGDYYLADRRPTWQVNVDFAVRVGFRQALYGGVGLAVAHRAFEKNGVPTLPGDTKVGINLYAGAGPPRYLKLPLRPYVEVRQTFVADFDGQLYVVGGVNVPIGG